MVFALIAAGLFVQRGCSSLDAATPSPSRYEQNLPTQTRADSATRLTTPPDGASDQNPAFSPDGTRLVFTRFDEGYNDGPAGLFLLDLDSSELVRLTPAEDQDNVNLPGAAWDATTDRIVFSSDRLESDDLWRVAPDGTDLSAITTHSRPPWYIEPSWSPDGQWIVFEADDDVPDDQQQGSIWKVRSDGTGLTPLTDGPGGGTDDRQPNWSPGGDRILFQRRVPGSEDWNLYTMATGGSDIRPVTTSPWSDTDASWSPDGDWIVYSSDHGGLPAPNIFAVPAGGGTPTRVTQDDTHEDGAPSWSPDGEWIAFESHPGQDEDTPSALWRISVGDSDPSSIYLPLALKNLPSSPNPAEPMPLDDVAYWGYHIQDIHPLGAVDALVASCHDMLVGLPFGPADATIGLTLTLGSGRVAARRMTVGSESAGRTGQPSISNR
jgi:TolB protein